MRTDGDGGANGTAGVRTAEAPAAPAGAATAARKAEIARRIRETFLASADTGRRGGVRAGGDAGRVDERLRLVAERAAFYYKWPVVPSWPPQLLARKIMRKVLKPVLWPIAEFHLAVRDALSELRDRGESLGDEQREETAALERRVEELSGEVAALTAQVATLTAAMTATPVPPSVPVTTNGANGASHHGNGNGAAATAAVGGGARA